PGTTPSSWPRKWTGRFSATTGCSRCITWPTPCGKGASPSCRCRPPPSCSSARSWPGLKPSGGAACRPARRNTAPGWWCSTPTRCATTTAFVRGWRCRPFGDAIAASAAIIRRECRHEALLHRGHVPSSNVVQHVQPDRFGIGHLVGLRGVAFHRHHEAVVDDQHDLAVLVLDAALLADLHRTPHAAGQGRVAHDHHHLREHGRVADDLHLHVLVVPVV